MKSWISRFACMAGLLVASSAFALTVTQPVLLPGVNAAGNLSFGLGATIPIKANINVKTGAFRATAKGKVQNLSGAKQTFLNPAITIPGATLTKIKYVVSSKGACTGTATGVTTFIP